MKEFNKKASMEQLAHNKNAHNYSCQKAIDRDLCASFGMMPFESPKRMGEASKGVCCFGGITWVGMFHWGDRRTKVRCRTMG
jgi:hypothetical protein